MKVWSAIGAFALALAVMLGAFGAHALRDRLDAYSIGIYDKAVFYHFVHALGILIVSMRAGSKWVCALLCAGIVLFSLVSQRGELALIDQRLDGFGLRQDYGPQHALLSVLLRDGQARQLPIRLFASLRSSFEFPNSVGAFPDSTLQLFVIHTHSPSCN